MCSLYTKSIETEQPRVERRFALAQAAARDEAQERLVLIARRYSSMSVAIGSEMCAIEEGSHRKSIRIGRSKGRIWRGDRYCYRIQADGVYTLVS
jgi:hypothetical protein